jgi:hypothetical protein
MFISKAKMLIILSAYELGGSFIDNNVICLLAFLSLVYE